MASAALRGLEDLVDVDHFQEHQLEIAVSVAVYRMDVWVGLACGSGKTLIAGLALKMMCEPNQNYYGIMESPMKLSIKGTARQLQRLGVTVVLLNNDTRLDVCNMLAQETNPSTPTMILGDSKQLTHPAFLAALRFGGSNSNTPTSFDFEELPLSPIGLIVVDEAHTVKRWSHNFKSSQSKLGRIADVLNTWPCLRCPMMALTATATAKERAWIMENLRFSTNPAYVEEVVKSLRRKNVLIRCHFDPSLNGKDWEKKKAKDVLDSVKDGHVVVVFVNEQK